MPSYGSGDALRRTVQVLVQTGGTGDIDTLKAALTQLDAVSVTIGHSLRAQGASALDVAAALKEYSSASASVAKVIAEMERQTRAATDAFDSMADVQAKLGQMTARTAQDLHEAGDDSAAYAKQLKENHEKAAEAARAGADATRAAAQVGTQAVRDEMEAQESVKQAVGDAMRARIDAHARSERSEQQFAATHAQVMATVRQSEGDTMRARIDAHVRAEQAMEEDAAKARETAERIREADERIANAHQQLAVSYGAAAGKSKMTREEVERLEQKQMGAAQTTIALAYAMDDLNAANGDWLRGLMYTTNNIPMIASGAAKWMGVATTSAMLWAGGIGAAAVGLAALAKNWEFFASMLGMGKVQTEAEAMDALGKATHRTADEQRKLNEYKEREAAIEDMRKAKNVDQREQATAVREAIGELGEKDLVRGLVSADAENLKSDPLVVAAQAAVDKRVEELRFTSMAGGGFRPRTEQEHAQAVRSDKFLGPLRRALEEAQGQAAERALAEAISTPEGLARVHGAVARAPGAFPEGAEAAFRWADPAFAREKDAEGDAVERANEDARANRKDRDREKKAADQKLQHEADKNAERQARNLTQDISRAMAKHELAPAQKEAAIAQAEKTAQATLAGDVLERVKDAAENARLQLENRAGAAVAKADAAANRAQAAADREAKRVGDRFARESEPQRLIREAGAPMVNELAWHGVPHARAERDVTAELKRIMDRGFSLQQATLGVMDQMPDYLMDFQTQLVQMEARLRMLQSKLNQAADGAQRARVGAPSMLSPVAKSR